MFIRVAAPKQATASVIFLHGLGDTANGWSFLPQECHRKATFQHVNFVLPTAPVRDYPALGGPTTGWFDLKHLGASLSNTVDDSKGFFDTFKTIEKLIQAEISSGVDPSRIVIGGFSQGAAASESFACVYSAHKLAGFVCLSGFLPIPAIKDVVEARSTVVQADVPVFLAHGKSDPIVPFSEIAVAEKALAEFGLKKVEVHTYAGLAHSVDSAELSDIISFLEKVLPSQ